ncbi:nuclear transport factor 2 family protein [Streptomyces albireticuli]|uniref:nuclear transport factor 2 family protein n=1 Tax=Streptomyces albireticuli TaxID=1940 RepID=UPI003692BBF4
MPHEPGATTALTTGIHLEIQQFYAHHMYAADSGDFATWAAGFTEDGVFVSNGLPEPLTGRTAIDAATRKGAAARAERGATHRHVVTNLDLRPLTGGEVHARAYVLVVESLAGGGSALYASTVCEDRLVRRDGGWLVRERRVTRDDLPPTASTA